ncbi:hypothetical protein [Serratia marcescens]|uniref:hypothetical protein n=1 Tax=Serratia marcescens TaxID=615 RepID=UPI00148B49FC|nr:hypothetical protein [Serratia marcescens]QJU42337.1 hypothetical protein HMI62_24855 [Serratia marcescens]
MPVSASQHRASTGAYNNKHHGNFRGNTTTQVQSISPSRSAIPDETCRIGSSINKAINSHEELNRPLYQTHQGVIVPLMLLLSQVRLAEGTLTTPADIPSLVSDRGISSLFAVKTASPDNNGNDFSAMLNPVVNALYETGEFIARHDLLT